MSEPRRSSSNTDRQFVDAISPDAQEFAPDDLSAPDPYDLTGLTATAAEMEDLGVVPQLLTIRVCRPDHEWWFRLHPDPRYRLRTGLLQFRETRETFLVHRSLWRTCAVDKVFRIATLYLGITKQGTMFLWPVIEPRMGQSSNDWTRSAHQIVAAAMDGWVRMQSNQQVGAYEMFRSPEPFEPQWPSQDFQELLRIAFPTVPVDSLDHPVIMRLRPEIRYGRA